MMIPRQSSTASFLLLILLSLSSSPSLFKNVFVQGETFTTIASCRAVMWTHTFTGDCCALSDLPNGGCQLEVVGGVCNITGPVWDVDIASIQRSICPTSAYNALGACKTDLDCPTQFCGLDGACHDYSCENFFDYSPVLDVDNATRTDLVCEPVMNGVEIHDVAQFGCAKTLGGLVPSVRGIGMAANEVCSGISKNIPGDEIIAFECYQMMAPVVSYVNDLLPDGTTNETTIVISDGTNFTDFMEQAEALRASGNLTCSNPLYFYPSAYEVIEYVNGQLVQNKIAGDGLSASLRFNETRIYNAMFAEITKTPDGATNGGGNGGNGGNDNNGDNGGDNNGSGGNNGNGNDGSNPDNNPNVQNNNSAAATLAVTRVFVGASLSSAMMMMMMMML